MVRYAKASPKVQRVDTTTNASLLTKDRSLEIIDAGLDRINISVEGINADQYRDFSGHKMDYQQFVDNIAFFYDHKFPEIKEYKEQHAEKVQKILAAA